jgi:hypothetical protein
LPDNLNVKKKKSLRHKRTQAIEQRNETPPRAVPDPLEVESWTASVKSHLLTKWTLLVTFVGVVLALAGILTPIAIEMRKTPDATSREKGKTIATVVPEVSPAPSPIVSPNSSVVESKETPQTTQPTDRSAFRNLATTRVQKAQNLYHQRKYQQALAECNEALRVDPRNKAARTLKARIERTVQILAENDKPTH